MVACSEEARIFVIALSAISADLIDLVGGKAAGLSRLITAGEQVPDGFCLTTAAFRRHEIPQDEVLAAYHALGDRSVAVRSSATTEDRADASFAGQLDTIVNVSGPDALIKAIDTCWESANSARAVAYRRGVMSRTTCRWPWSSRRWSIRSPPG